MQTNLFHSSSSRSKSSFNHNNHNKHNNFLNNCLINKWDKHNNKCMINIIKILQIKKKEETKYHFKEVKQIQI